MHELGIVFHIIDAVEEVAREGGIARVSRVTVELGEVSGIVSEFLVDCWRWAADRNDVLRGAELEVEVIPAVTRCESCGAAYATVQHGCTCPHCGSNRTYLVQGAESIIKEITVPDEGSEGLVVT